MDDLLSLPQTILSMFPTSCSASLPSSTSIPLAIISTFITILIFFTKFPNKKKSHPLPPGPTPLPFIGCIMQMLRNRPTFRWIHKLMDQFDSPIVCIKLGPSTHVIAVSSPAIACEFLRKKDILFASRPEILSATLVSDGYLTTILSPFGNQWKKMRKFLNQDVLSLQAHKWLQPKRDEEATHLLLHIRHQLEKQGTLTEGGLINIRFMSQHFFGNLIRKMVFGTRFFGEGMEDGGSGKEEIEHVEAIFTVLRYLYAFCITDYIPCLRGKIDVDGHEKMVRTAVRCIRKYQDPLIDERIQMWENETREVEDDLLDVFIKHGSPKLTPQEIKAQILEVMLAFIDNPANAIEWTMAEMINDPIILRKAVKELDDEVGLNRLVEEQDLPRLNYLKACIKESFRLHPFAPFNPPHVSLEDTTIAGYFIPKGSHVMLSRPGLGRNPDAWTDPMRFDPDRHLEVDGKQVVLTDNELRMISFSTGRRGCPGVLLGSTITTMLLARMVQGFTWEVPEDEMGIKLVENHDDLFLAKPLVAIAKPRLAEDLYPKP